MEKERRLRWMPSADWYPGIAAVALALLPVASYPQSLHLAARHATHCARTSATHQIKHSSTITMEPLGARIVAFARGWEGRQVSTGECAALADTALRAAGARSASDFGEMTADADYIWGRPVSLASARPGDILQFRDYQITTVVETTIQLPEGSAELGETYNISARPHHTAIVERNLGSELLILEQNAPPAGRAVQEFRLPLAPARTSRAAGDGSSDTVTTTIRVDGAIRAYRPQPDT